MCAVLGVPQWETLRDAAQVCPPNGDVWCPCASSQCVGGACTTAADGTCPILTTKFAPLTVAPGQVIKVRHFAQPGDSVNRSAVPGSVTCTGMAEVADQQLRSGIYCSAPCGG